MKAINIARALRHPPKAPSALYRVADFTGLLWDRQR